VDHPADGFPDRAADSHRGDSGVEPSPAGVAEPPAPPVRTPGAGRTVPEAHHLRPGEPHAGGLLVGGEDGRSHGTAVLTPLHLAEMTVRHASQPSYPA